MSDPDMYRRLAALERWRDEMASVEAYGPAEDWIAPTLLNSWADFGAGYAGAGYYKDPLGVVHIRGLIAGGTATPGTTLFVLPAGYRPSATLLYATISSSGGTQVISRLDIDNSGNVTIQLGGNGYFSLNVPPFRVA